MAAKTTQDQSMYVAADDDMKNIIILGDCEVLDVGITDSEKPNASAESLSSPIKRRKKCLGLAIARNRLH